MLFGPPGVEALVIAALEAGLTDLLPDIRVATKVPNPRPAEFIRIELFGGTGETIVSDNCSIYLEGWAETGTRAERIVAYARAVLLEQDGLLFGVTTIGAQAHLPDPTTAQERYRALMGVRVRHIPLV